MELNEVEMIDIFSMEIEMPCIFRETVFIRYTR
jgi:hypothetical protein